MRTIRCMNHQLARLPRLSAFIAVGALAAVVLGGCAPRATGVEARRQADERFRRTTSLVSFDQARQAFESGDLDKARREVEAAIARSDGEARYWCLLGRIEIEAARLERAVTALEKSVERDPAFAEPHYYLGIVEQRWGAGAKAIEHYLKAAELDSARVSYVLAAAELMVAERRLDEARELLLPKLAYFEHNAAMHELIGDICALKGDDKSAVASYERSVVIDASAPLIAEKLLAALGRAGEWQRCLAYARQQREAAAAQSNGHAAVVPADILRHEGRALSMLGRHAEARAVFADYTRSYPESLEAWRDFAAESVALGDYARAQGAAERLIALDQNAAVGYALRGLVSERTDKIDEAIRWYRLAVERDPRDADAHAALGLALRRTGARDEGTAALKRALEIDPGFALAAEALESDGT